MPNMIQSEVMKNHGVPVVFLELRADMPCDVIVDLCKVLQESAPKHSSGTLEYMYLPRRRNSWFRRRDQR